MAFDLATAKPVKIGSTIGASSTFDTQLSPQEETDFQSWKSTYAPRDSGADYDLRGAFKAGLRPDPKTGHWPDTFKKPNHPTFSDQSKYAKDAPDKAGHWEGDKYVPHEVKAKKGFDLSTARPVKPTFGEAVSESASNVWKETKKAGGDLAAIADLPASLPAMLAGGLGFTGGVLGTGAAALKAGKPVSRKELVTEGTRTGEEFAAPLANPVQRLMKYFGHENDYKQSDVQDALGVFSSWLKKGNKWIEQKTGGAVLEEDAAQIENALMAGGPVEAAKLVMKARPKARAGTSERVEPGPLSPEPFTEEHQSRLNELERASSTKPRYTLGPDGKPVRMAPQGRILTNEEKAELKGLREAKAGAAPSKATEADDFIKRMDKESEELSKEIKGTEKPTEPAKAAKPTEPAGDIVGPPHRPFVDEGKWGTPLLERLATAADQRLTEAKESFEKSKAVDRRHRQKSLKTDDLEEHSRRLEDASQKIKDELEARKSRATNPEELITRVHRGTKSGTGLGLPTEGTGLYVTTDENLAGKFGSVESFDVKPPKKPYNISREDTPFLSEDPEKIRLPIKDSDTPWMKLNKETFQALETRLEEQGADAMEDKELIKLFGADLSKKLRSQGYDAVQVGERGSKDSWMVVLDENLIPKETKEKIGFSADRFQRGKADPKLLAAAAVGMVAGAAAGGDERRVSGALAGAVGGALLVGAFAARMFPRAEGGVQARELSNSLFRLTQRGKAKQLELLKFSTSVPKDYKDHAEEIYHSLEDPTIKLSPRAQELKTKYVDPIMRQNALLREDLKKKGLDVGEDVDSYVHRIPKGKPSIFEQLEQTSPQTKTLSQFAPPLEERTTFKLTDPETGETLYGVKDETGQGFKIYRDKEIVGSGKVSPKLWKEGKVPFDGRTLKRSQATTKELETHTPIEYHHDALASAIASNARLSRIRNNNVFLESFLKSPEASEVALKTDAPKGWREVPVIPQLRGYKFAPRVANVLEDFAGGQGPDIAENIGKVSRILTGSLFWNPLPHIFNVLDHSIVQRGLVSGWLNPAAYPRLMRTTIRAAKAVTEQNEDYLRFVKEGAGLMYPNVLLHDFSGKVLEQLGHRPEMGVVATAWGYANPLEMVRRIYSFSRKNLWAANDILMMQAYLEKEMVKPEAAIADVEKHIPNYRVPDVVLGSRVLSQALQSPIVTAFGRYDYGRMKSYGEMVKGLIGKDRGLKDRAKALDQIAMLSVMGVVVYPLLMDNAAKALTGNQNAEATRFGASGIPYLVYSYLHGKKQFSQVLGSSYPMGMALRSGVEIASNRDLFTGKHLFEDPGDIGSYMAKQLSPIGTAARIESGQLTPGQFGASAIGIRSPRTPEQKREQATKQRRARVRKQIDAILNR